MSSNVSGTMAFTPGITNKNTTAGPTNATEKLNTGSTTTFTNGTSSGQVDVFYNDKQTALAASTTQSYDLSGTLEDGLCNAAVFVTVKSIYVTAASGNNSNITIDGTIANAFNSYLSTGAKISIAPGGKFYLEAPATGFAVTAGTGDIFAIENTDGSNTAEYEVTIIGTSA